jgi:hypothetical protein
VRAVPLFCELYPGICLTTRKNMEKPQLNSCFIIQYVSTLSVILHIGQRNLIRGVYVCIYMCVYIRLCVYTYTYTHRHAFPVSYCRFLCGDVVVLNFHLKLNKWKSNKVEIRTAVNVTVNLFIYPLTPQPNGSF